MKIAYLLGFALFAHIIVGEDTGVVINPGPVEWDRSDRSSCTEGEETNCKMEYGNDGCCARQVYDGVTTFFCSYIHEVDVQVSELKALSEDNELYCDISHIIKGSLALFALLMTSIIAF